MSINETQMSLDLRRILLLKNFTETLLKSGLIIVIPFNQFSLSKLSKDYVESRKTMSKNGFSDCDGGRFRRRRILFCHELRFRTTAAVSADSKKSLRFLRPEK